MVYRFIILFFILAAGSTSSFAQSHDRPKREHVEIPPPAPRIQRIQKTPVAPSKLSILCFVMSKTTSENPDSCVQRHKSSPLNLDQVSGSYHWNWKEDFNIAAEIDPEFDTVVSLNSENQLSLNSCFFHPFKYEVSPSFDGEKLHLSTDWNGVPQNNCNHPNSEAMIKILTNLWLDTCGIGCNIGQSGDHFLILNVDSKASIVLTKIRP